MVMTPAQIASEASVDYAKRIAEYEKTRANNGRRARDYTQMISDVEEWTCPEKLNGMKDFMLEQLREAFKFDVSDMDSPKSYWKPPVAKSPAAWHAETVARAAKDVAYHTEEYEKEVQRTAERNEYLSALWECLPDV